MTWINDSSFWQTLWWLRATMSVSGGGRGAVWMSLETICRNVGFTEQRPPNHLEQEKQKNVILTKINPEIETTRQQLWSWNTGPWLWCSTCCCTICKIMFIQFLCSGEQVSSLTHDVINVHRSLQELTRISISDVHRICTTSRAPKSRLKASTESGSQCSPLKTNRAQ